MRKSEADVLHGLVAGLLKDYLAIYPSDATEVERDLSRLSLAVQTRGLGVFLLDLPALGKHFDRCLANGALVPSKLPLGSLRWNTSPIPKLFSGLVMRIFERSSGRLRDDVDSTSVALLRQLYNFAKGFNHECSHKRQIKAVSEFYTVDREVRSPTLNWADDRIDLSRTRDLFFDPFGLDKGPVGERGLPRHQQSGSDREFGEVLHRISDYVATSFGIFSATASKPRHGPGAVSDLGGQVGKYHFPYWSEKLEKVFPYADLAFANYADWAASSHRAKESEPPSKLLMVPKTAKAPRLIASESTAHQWCQQIILGYLLDGIASTPLRNSISIKDQNPSRVLTQRASQTRSHATIDLSAASDRVSCWLVERIFRANPSLLDALHSVRSRYIVNGTRIHDQSIPEGVYPIRKFTTMGSACTFPIQSIVFTLIAVATVLSREGCVGSRRDFERVSRQVRVYGDDIIVPNAHFDAVVRNLTTLGLQVNDSKSYQEGNFRESCGMDAFQGDDVTPANIKSIADESKPATIMAALDHANNFFTKGFWHSAQFIESTIPRWVLRNLPVVAHGSGRPGLKSFVGPNLSHLRKGWDKNLQKETVKVVLLKGAASRASQPGEHDLFQYFIESPNPEVIWEPGRVTASSAYLALGRAPSELYIS